MKQYLDLMLDVLDNGDDKDDRTGIGTISSFGHQLKFDLRDGFPAVTTKKLAWKAVVSELLWFLKGSTDLYELRAILHGEDHRYNDEKKTIWDGNYNEQAKSLGYVNGYMGELYGAQWRNYGSGVVDVWDSEDGSSYDESVGGVDQIRMVLNEAKENPTSRRLIIDAWNPRAVWSKQKLYDMHNQSDMQLNTNTAALPPCHILYQFNISGKYIDLQWYQRSVDHFLGESFNIASYGILLSIFARILGYVPRYLVGSLGDVHIYKNHIDQCNEQLKRDPLPLPTIWINPELKTLEDFENAKVDDFKLIDYQHHPAIKADMAV